MRQVGLALVFLMRRNGFHVDKCSLFHVFMFIKVVISCFEGVFDHLRDTYYYRRGVAGLAVLILWERLSRLPTLIVFFMSV